MRTTRLRAKIEDLEKDSIGVSTLENLNESQAQYLKIIASWVENKRRDHGEDGQRIGTVIAFLGVKNNLM